jgi:hypothetical protein
MLARRVGFGENHMTVDRSFIEKNRASSARMRKLASSLSDEQLRRSIGKQWTIYSSFAHLAFWDLRVMHILDETKRAGKLVAPEIDVAVNDILNPLFLAIPPRLAAQLAFQTAEALDEMLEHFPSELLEQIHARQARWVGRALHRDAHLARIEAASKSRSE